MMTARDGELLQKDGWANWRTDGPPPRGMRVEFRWGDLYWREKKMPEGSGWRMWKAEAPGDGVWPIEVHREGTELFWRRVAPAKPKVIQIAAATCEEENVVYVLRDDGTIWEMMDRIGSAWRKIALPEEGG